MVTKIDEAYFIWLYDQIKPKSREYKKLCYELHAKPFRWFVPNDDNRCEDGLNLRHDFLVEYGKNPTGSFLTYECTVFEMLVALAQRVEFLMDDLNSSKNHTSRWFFIMIRNLGLSGLTDNYGDIDGFDPIADVQIDRILERLIDRTYDFYGTGSLFPMKQRPLKDMAKVEIWYQLMLYLDENYVR